MMELWAVGGLSALLGFIIGALGVFAMWAWSNRD